MTKSKCGIALILVAAVFFLNNLSTYAATEVFIESEVGSFKPAKSSYLGTQIGAGPNIFNFVRIGDDLDIASTGIGIKYPISDRFKMFAGFSNIKAHGKENFGTIDANGNNLLIAGPDASGYFLPGPNNQITEGFYRTEYDAFNLRYGVEGDFKTRFKRLSLKPAIGIEYSSAITSNAFSGNIPFFVRRFAYNTKTKVRTFSPTLGLDLNYVLTPKLQLFGGGKFAYDLNNGAGKDRLSFTSFADEMNEMSNNKDTQTYSLKMGITYQPTPKTTISFQGNYKRIGNVPVVNIRDSLSDSDFSYKSADIYSGTIRASYKF